MVLIDADMIATRPLTELVERGRVATEWSPSRTTPTGIVAQWGELLELGHARRRPYVSSGLVALGGHVGDEVLALLDDRQQRVDIEQTFCAPRRRDLSVPLSRAGRSQRDPRHPA